MLKADTKMAMRFRNCHGSYFMQYGVRSTPDFIEGFKPSILKTESSQRKRLVSHEVGQFLPNTYGLAKEIIIKRQRIQNLCNIRRNWIIVSDNMIFSPTRVRVGSLPGVLFKPLSSLSTLGTALKCYA